ncbi:MAG: hypothetical protein ISS70_19135 [Phycisphaerae bacterium]|nr:hypothetical protein [Phycisphaerae bacterium]
MKYSIKFSGLAALLFCVFVGACQPYKPMPYVPKAGNVPNALICHDALGHSAEFKPWIMGGKCCCTPTRANFELHLKNQTIDKSMTYEKYLLLYSEKGVVTDLDHKDCGNYCKHGPHVVMGGKCMATPVVGTKMYEMVTYGPHRNLLDDQQKKTK